MKELSIEEKARRYDEAFNFAEQIHMFSSNPSEIKRMEELFPELAELEDERIRKDIISLIKETHVTDRYYDLNKMLAWLENQGEQKPTDNEMIEILHAEYEKGRADAIEEMQKPAWSEEEVEIIDWLVASFDCLKIPTDTFYQSKVRPFLISLRNKIQPIRKEWSEEDDKKAERIIRLLQEAYDINCIKGSIEWLKSLKDRVQPKQEWSKEDEKLTNRIEGWLDTLCDYLKDDNSPECIKDVKDILEQLKSFKNRVQPQPKQEWSDVDRCLLFRTIDNLKFLRDDISKDPKYAVNITDIEREITWLKSLRPQNKWKPSEEMLEALYRAVPQNVKEISEDEILLDKLYQGLKYGRVISNN